MIDNDVKKLVKSSHKLLDLKDAKLSQAYYYTSLPICIIDAVYSIGIRYTTTQNVVKHFCMSMQVTMYRAYESDFLANSKQLSIDEFIKLYERHSHTKLYNNKCRTSSKNGIPKSQAVLEFAKVLQKYQVNYMQDLAKVAEDEEFKNDIKKIKGQTSGISLRYFFMLAGDENKIKPDRMLHRFVSKSIYKKLTNDELIELLNKCFHILKKDYTNLTFRKLDHQIWKYQKSVDKSS